MATSAVVPYLVDINVHPLFIPFTRQCDTISTCFCLLIPDRRFFVVIRYNSSSWVYVSKQHMELGTMSNRT